IPKIRGRLFLQPHRSTKRPPHRTPPPRLQPPLSIQGRRKQDRRVLHARIPSRTRLHETHLRPHRPPRHHPRRPRAHSRRHRNRLPRIRRSPVPSPPPPRRRASTKCCHFDRRRSRSGEIRFSTTHANSPPLLRRLRVHHLPPRLPRARAPSLFFQQSL